MYSSTKFAVEGITEAMHAKLEPLDSHTTVVELGYLRPEFLDTSSLLATPDVIDKYYETPGAVRRTTLEYARYTHVEANLKCPISG